MKERIYFPKILVEEAIAQKFIRIADIMLVFPLVVTATVFVFCLVLWRTAALMRFSPMIWLLGFWMVATEAMFAYAIFMRRKAGKPYLLLVLALAAASVAIYFTSLSRFARLFLNPIDLILPGVIGCIYVAATWLIVFRFRKSS